MCTKKLINNILNTKMPKFLDLLKNVNVNVSSLYFAAVVLDETYNTTILVLGELGTNSKIFKEEMNRYSLFLNNYKNNTFI